MKKTLLSPVRAILAVSVFVMVCAVFISCAKEQPSIKVGLGETVITPRENTQMAGFARSQVSTGTHDDLHARSLVIEGTDGTTVVLMSVSLVGLNEDFGNRIRSAIKDSTGIPESNIIISCTHTHAGPNVGGASDAYRSMLLEQTVASAVTAWKKRAPGRIGIGSTVVQELGRNRRWLLYGGLHPDPEVAVMKIEDTKGKLLGVAFNYGCHPSALDWQNTLFSEDWPYYAIEGIKKTVGKDVWVAYYQSAEGNINVGYSSELSAVGADMPIRNYGYIEIKGNQMTDAVIKALPDVQTTGNPAIAAARDFFEYPLRESYPVTLEQAEKDAKKAIEELAVMEKIPELQGTRKLDTCRRAVFQTGQRLGAARRFYGNQDRPKTRRLEQQAVRIGNTVFVTFPGELFSDIGLAIKKQSPLDKTFVIGVTPGPGGYLPTAKEFIEGDYEVDGSSYSPKTEQFCIDSSLSLIKKIAD
ncbi:neutral/alkaline non-lysosomal ceramidase N-terminal domain-containing protein [bacterium]|nr:neutral/alkaline non-lysosomal ceramidase N-terminal domain-containing protein [bacterium]